LVSVSSPVGYSRATDHGRLFFDLVRFHSGAHRSGSRDGGSGAAGEEPQAEALLVLAKLMLAARPHSP